MIDEAHKEKQTEAAAAARAEVAQPTEPLLQFFGYSHLPAHLQAASKGFCDLAQQLLELPSNPERTVALRKLLEAKDCAVRAVLFK
jgi:hypothetical protein